MPVTRVLPPLHTSLRRVAVRDVVEGGAGLEQSRYNAERAIAMRVGERPRQRRLATTRRRGRKTVGASGSGGRRLLVDVNTGSRQKHGDQIRGVVTFRLACDVQLR